MAIYRALTERVFVFMFVRVCNYSGTCASDFVLLAAS